MKWAGVAVVVPRDRLSKWEPLNALTIRRFPLPLG